MFLSFRAGRRFRIALCAALLTAAALFRFAAASAGARPRKSAELTIVMYHSIVKDPDRQGQYVVSPAALESDMSYLRARGYETVVVRDLIDFVDRGVPLPEKPVMLTFDDGCYNNYLYAYPLALKYGMRIVISPVGSYTDRYTQGDADHEIYSYLTWSEVAELADSGAVEIQNHSYDLHGTSPRLGARKLRTESAAAYRAMLETDLRKMQDRVREMTGHTPTAFVYPYGIVSRESISVVRGLGFRASMVCEDRKNALTAGDPDCLFGLGRYLRPAGLSSESYFRRIGVV